MIKNEEKRTSCQLEVVITGSVEITNPLSFFQTNGIRHQRTVTVQRTKRTMQTQTTAVVSPQGALIVRGSRGNPRGTPLLV